MVNEFECVLLEIDGGTVRCESCPRLLYNRNQTWRHSKSNQTMGSIYCGGRIAEMVRLPAWITHAPDTLRLMDEMLPGCCVKGRGGGGVGWGGSCSQVNQPVYLGRSEPWKVVLMSRSSGFCLSFIFVFVVDKNRRRVRR